MAAKSGFSLADLQQGAKKLNTVEPASSDSKGSKDVAVDHDAVRALGILITSNSLKIIEITRKTTVFHLPLFALFYQSPCSKSWTEIWMQCKLGHTCEVLTELVIDSILFYTCPYFLSIALQN